MGSLLPKALLPGLSFSLTPTAAAPVVLPTETIAPKVVVATTTLPPGTLTPVPPTATRVPPTATATPVQVYTADFSDSALDWNLSTDAGRQTYVQDSAFHAVYTTTAFGTAWNVPKSFPVFKDFTLDLKARYESGPEGNGYGAVFRYVDNSNFYYFIVTADGKWGLARYAKGALAGLVRLTPDSAILKGKAANSVRIVAKGPVFTFSVNGKQVGTFTDSTHAAGTVGLFMSNETGGAFHSVYEALKATILLP